MEKMILIYCILILCIVFAILGLLLWDVENKAGKKVDSKSNLILAGVSLSAGLVLHPNYIILPWAREQKGELAAFANFGMLAVIFSVLMLFLFKSLFAAKANLPNTEMVGKRSLPY